MTEAVAHLLVFSGAQDLIPSTVYSKHRGTLLYLSTLEEETGESVQGHS